MQRLIVSRRHAILTTALVVAGLAASVVVARAALPTITDVTVPPVAHFGVACPDCHRVAPVAPVVAEPRGSDVASGTVKPDDPKGQDATDDQGGHETVPQTPAHRDTVDKRSTGQSKSKADKRARRSADRGGSAAHGDEGDEHETIGEHAYERDHDDSHGGQSDGGGEDHGGEDHGGSSD